VELTRDPRLASGATLFRPRRGLVVAGSAGVAGSWLPCSAELRGCGAFSARQFSWCFKVGRSCAKRIHLNSAGYRIRVLTLSRMRRARRQNAREIHWKGLWTLGRGANPRGRDLKRCGCLRLRGLATAGDPLRHSRTESRSPRCWRPRSRVPRRTPECVSISSTNRHRPSRPA
jgi:hypothetical protein